MAWSLAQAAVANATTGGAGNTHNRTYGSATTTGNMGYAVVTSYGATQNCTGVTDNKGNTWIEIDTVNRDPDTDTLQVFYCPNMTGGSGHIVTCTMANVENIGLLIAEFAGLDTAPLDTHDNSANGVSNSPLSNSITPTTANSLLIGAFTDQITNATEPTYGSGWTKLGFAGDANNSVRVYAQYKNLAVAAPTTSGVSTGSANNKDWGAAIAAFKEPSGGGGPTALPPSQLSMCGFGI